MISGSTKFERKRLRRHLRNETHWKNSREFFIAILFECGPPPYPITRTYITSGGRLLSGEWVDMVQWRMSVVAMVSKHVPRYFSKSVIVEDYLKWLLHEQEQGRIRTSGL